MDWNAMKAETMAALADPRVGDRFHEMYSFWLYITAIDGDRVVTLEGSPPVTFPDEGKQRVQTKAEFQKRMQYDTHAGSWVTLGGRGHDVTGWALYADDAAPAPGRSADDAG